MEIVFTTQGRTDLAKARAGQIASVPKITHIAVGTGTALPTANDISLQAEVVRKAVTTTFPTATTVRYSVDILTTDVPAGTQITEAGLIDNNLKLLARMVFPAKATDATLRVEFDEQF